MRKATRTPSAPQKLPMPNVWLPSGPVTTRLPDNTLLTSRSSPLIVKLADATRCPPKTARKPDGKLTTKGAPAPLTTVTEPLRNSNPPDMVTVKSAAPTKLAIAPLSNRICVVPLRNCIGTPS